MYMKKHYILDLADAAVELLQCLLPQDTTPWWLWWCYYALHLMLKLAKLVSALKLRPQLDLPRRISKKRRLRCVPCEAFLLRQEIVWVDFVPGEVQPQIVGGDPGRAAPKVGVQDFVIGLGVVLEEP